MGTRGMGVWLCARKLARRRRARQGFRNRAERRSSEGMAAARYRPPNTTYRTPTTELVPGRSQREEERARRGVLQELYEEVEIGRDVEVVAEAEIVADA